SSQQASPRRSCASLRRNEAGSSRIGTLFCRGLKRGALPGTGHSVRSPVPSSSRNTISGRILDGRFCFDVVAAIEPKAGVAASPAHLAHLIAEGRKAQVRAIVHEPYEPEDASRFVAGKLAVPVVLLAVAVGS